MGLVKLVRNLSIFISSCYVVTPSVAFTGFIFFVYYSWKYIPEIATGVSFAETSARARGVTILIGLILLMLLIIGLFVALSR